MPFAERQAFRQPWFWAILLAATLASSGVMAYGLYQQLALHRPFGNHPTSDTALAWTSGLLIAANLLFLWFFWRMELVVRVEPDAVHVRFWPFVRRKILYPDVRSAEPRAYNALREYGGWGIRYGRAGKAYNVSGNEGVQLELASGERLLIGSQRAGELAEAIRRHLPHHSAA